MKNIARTALLCTALLASRQIWLAGQDYTSWKDYGGGADSSHFVALDHINKTNVKDLEVAWTYSTGLSRSMRPTGKKSGFTKIFRD